MNNPGFAVPALACDCHMHIFGDPDIYPPATKRAYDPTPMELDRYNAEAARMGFGRVVFVQPSAYGTDNSCMLDALQARGASSRGVAVIDAATTDAELADMAALGIRGVRLNLVSNGIRDAGAAIAELQAAAARVRHLGWHVQIYARPALFTDLAPAVADLGVPVVVDHMGATDGQFAARRPGFDALLRMLADGVCWVKLSGANRVSQQKAGFTDAIPVIHALVAANPARSVWGTDWPHIGPHVAGSPSTVIYMPHDNLALLHLLGAALPDAATRQAVLVDNPARLYGF